MTFFVCLATQLYILPPVCLRRVHKERKYSIEFCFSTVPMDSDRDHADALRSCRSDFLRPHGARFYTWARKFRVASIHDQKQHGFCFRQRLLLAILVTEVSLRYRREKTDVFARARGNNLLPLEDLPHIAPEVERGRSAHVLSTRILEVACRCHNPL